MKKDERSFQEKLKIGNDKEELLVELFNSKGIVAKLNNEENVKDVDIELTNDNIYVDSKYLESEFMWSKQFTGIEPENCLLINKSHIESYANKELNTGKKVWVAFLIDYRSFGIYEYRFFPNSYLVHQLKNTVSWKEDKLNVDRQFGMDFKSFLDYLSKLRVIKQKY